MEETYLVTGGAGFIGANFVRLMNQDAKIRIINLDKLTYSGSMENLTDLPNPDNHIFIQGDIGDRDLTQKIFRDHKPTAVVNFAAESHVDRSIDAPDEFIQANIVGVFNLLEEARGYWQGLPEAAKGAFRFLQVSTDEVYGSLGLDDPAFTEEHPYRPNSPYSASKASSDHLVRAYQHTYGMPTLTTNCSNNYGPYQFPEKLIPLIFLNALEGRALPIYGDGSNIRDWLYVEDHCRAIHAVLQQGRVGETYNIGGNHEMTNKEIVTTLCRLLDEMVPESPHRPHESLITYVADRPGHDLRYAIDASKTEGEIGWSPAETFESGLRKTMQWYLDNQTWCDTHRHGGVHAERLGVVK